MQLTGIILIAASLALFMVERLSQALSSLLGKKLCGDRYLQAVDGVVGDASCGFNMDMYLTTGLEISLSIGVILLIVSVRKGSS